jgi:hypothetical protein
MAMLFPIVCYWLKRETSTQSSVLWNRSSTNKIFVLHILSHNQNLEELKDRLSCQYQSGYFQTYSKWFLAHHSLCQNEAHFSESIYSLDCWSFCCCHKWLSLNSRGCVYSLKYEGPSGCLVRLSLKIPNWNVKTWHLGNEEINECITRKKNVVSKKVSITVGKKIMLLYLKRLVLQDRMFNSCFALMWKH